MKKFSDLLDNPFGFDTDNIMQNCIYIERGCNWGDENEFMFYLGPCDYEETLSDSISFVDEFMEEILKKAGINVYDLHTAENSHEIYLDSIEEANIKFDNLVKILIEYGYIIKN